MKKLCISILIGLATGVVFWITSSGTSFVTVARASRAAETLTEESLQKSPSPDSDRPPELLKALQEAILQEAWAILDQHNDPIPLWDGTTLTGHSLARFLFEQGIPLAWDRQDLCGGEGCSLSYCEENLCTHEDGQPGVEPIFLRPIKVYDPQHLAGILAHEIYHRLQPFGSSPVTLFEEYWAYWMGAQVSGEARPVFSGEDPLVPTELVGWFERNGIRLEYQLSPYPAELISAISPYYSLEALMAYIFPSSPPK